MVEGTPRSLQASGRGKALWKEDVKAAAEAAMAGKERFDFVDVSVRILHFCFEWADTDGDLDNIAKPIIDAMCLVVLFNDNQVRQVLLRRTDLARDKVTEIEGATPALAAKIQEALASSGGATGFVHVTVDDKIDHRRLQ